MDSPSSVVFIGVAPHPPIMVPEVGGEMISEVHASIEAMREMVERVIKCDAETVVLISPHAPLDARAFVAYSDPHLWGDFRRFRAPQTSINFPLDIEIFASIKQVAAEDDLTVVPLEGFEVDHGTSVPLYFLQHFGWDGHVVALGYSFLSNEEHMRFGACVRRAVEKQNRRVAFIASGDLSHRLTPEAPAGYHPDAHLFDKQVISNIISSQPTRIADIDKDLIKLAGECGYRSMLVALGVLQTLQPRCELLNYEAPFGVGYMVAQLMSVR